MTAVFTAVFEAKRQAVEIISAIGLLVSNGVQVTYGHPGRDIAREFIYVGQTAEWDAEWAQLGARSRDETFGLELVINLLTPGLSEIEQDLRAELYLKAIATALRVNPTGVTLNGAVLWCGLRPKALYEWPTTEGRETEIRAVIGCKARV